MSQNVIAIIVKFLITLALAWAVFGLINNAAFGWILTLAVIATAVNYVVGDLLALPRYGNIVAAAGDGIMAAVVAAILHAVFPGVQATAASLVLFAVLIGVAEYFFHRYLLTTEASPN